MGRLDYLLPSAVGGEAIDSLYDSEEEHRGLRDPTSSSERLQYNRQPPRSIITVRLSYDKQHVRGEIISTFNLYKVLPIADS